MNGGDARLRRGVRVAYYLGRPASEWVDAMERRRRAAHGDETDERNTRDRRSRSSG
jgi:hypothetical protein